MIEFLTAPISDTSATRPALLWILGITLAAIATVLLRDGWRWFIALGQRDEIAVDGNGDYVEDDAMATNVDVPQCNVSPRDRRSAVNPPTGFGRRRTDQFGMAQSA